MTSSVILRLCSFTHDSAAALIVDGRLTGFAEEERLTGDKHTAAYPEQTITWLLAEAGIGPEDVSQVAYNFDGHRYSTLSTPPNSTPGVPTAGTAPSHVLTASARSTPASRSGWRTSATGS